MNATLTRARRIRAERPLLAAADAVRLARWELEAPTMEDGETWEEDGYTLTVSIVPDECADPDDAPTFSDTATAESVVNASYSGDSRRPGWGKRYAETPNYPRTERIAEYRRRGASRSVSVELAERDMRKELARWTWDYGPSIYGVIVRATRAGVELGSASLWGVDFGETWAECARYLADVVADLAPDALENARATLASLCECE